MGRMLSAGVPAFGSSASTVSVVSILLLGFVLGMRHATDADHVVAISTIVSRERRVASAAWIGALWGVGHTLTILAVGVGIIGFTLVIPPRVGLSMECSVGLMLVLLGWMNLRGFAKDAEPEQGSPENSIHAMDRWLGGWTLYQWLRPLVVGLVHGLAGSAAVALLVLTTVHDVRWAMAYLFLFGVGTIAGMMAITMAMASALKLAGNRSRWVHRRLSFATGLLSVGFGMFVVYQMGFAHGLFTGHPVWVPE